jgi:hypothetical protein
MVDQLVVKLEAILNVKEEIGWLQVDGDKNYINMLLQPEELKLMLWAEISYGSIFLILKKMAKWIIFKQFLTEMEQLCGVRALNVQATK